MSNPESYQPTPDEIKKAEEMMTPRQKEMSEIRNERGIESANDAIAGDKTAEELNGLIKRREELHKRLSSVKRVTKKITSPNFDGGPRNLIEKLTTDLTAEIQDNEKQIYEMTSVNMSEVEEREQAMQEMNEHEAKTQEPNGMEGEKTPDTQETKEKLKLRSIEFPEEMVGKPFSELAEYLKTTYGEAALARIPDDLNELPDELKDGNGHLFIGSSSHDRYGNVEVPGVYWHAEKFKRSLHRLDHGWSAHLHFVLLENWTLGMEFCP